MGQCGSYVFELGIANHQTVRLLLAPVTLDNRPETMLILLDPGSPQRLDALARSTDGLLESLEVQSG